MRLALAFLLITLTQVTADPNPPSLETQVPIPPPQAAIKYHAALLKAPHNPTLFARFFDAWLDEQPIESLATYLTIRAKTGNGEDLAILARFQLRRGLEDDALTTLNKAAAALPADPALPLERARILLRRLDFNTARKDLETAAASPDTALAIEAGKLIGKSYLREGDPVAATAAWEKLIAKHPANTEILEDLVELTASSDQPDQAIAYSRRLIESTDDAFRKTQHKLRLGELLADSGKSEEALTIWSETLSQTGEGSWLEKEIIARITTAFRRLDRIDALSAKLAELATANPRRLLIHRELAKLEAAEGKLDSAIGRFREVLRRSPGEAELREEFIGLLIDGQRFEDAAAELEKMISLSPKNPDLHLRMADLAHRRAEADPNRAIDSPPPLEVLAALEKARSLMPPGETSGIRIAGLMLSYGLNTQGEKLLSSLAADPNTTFAPAEALAAEYARTERKKEALEILTKVAKSPDVDTVLRAASSIASLGDPEASFAILSARLTNFPNQPSFLAALAQASLAAKKTSEAITPALRLVRLSTLPQEILDATRIATSVITASEKTDAEIASLTVRNDRKPSETCLLATLLETKFDSIATDAIFKNSTDPTLLRFHASLLSRRGDPRAAIAALRLLNQDTSKPDFLKELSELQLRAGLTADYLATLDEWQTAAPTAREPWIMASRLLRESSRQSEAIETTRRALTRFPGDEDFTSSLADLHQLSGDNVEAERIFWKLYDQAQDSTAQSRWAARLSMLAQRTGGTTELAEKFLARARSNSRSTGPVLALVELARAAGDREAIRAHLARALFIKPGDINIRIQLAEAEAAAGNPQARITILSDGLDKDPAGRLRTALAQAHINNGDVLKGMRILRALAGERASDPRSVESIAFSLCTKGHISEAIQYLRESLPGSGDWRSKYLLATMLVEDGREQEAIPSFIALLSEQSEITNIPQNPRSNFDPYQAGRLGQQNTALSEISLLSQVAQSASRPKDYRQANISQSLPTSVAHLRASALVQLASIASSGNTAAAEAITAARPPGLAFVIDLINDYKIEKIDFLTLLEKYPDQPGLFDLAWHTGNFYQEIEKRIPLLKRILAIAKPAPAIRLNLLSYLLRFEPDEPKHWNEIIATASEALRSDDVALINSAAQQLLNLALNEPNKLSTERITTIKELLLAYSTKPTHGPEIDHIRLTILAYAGTRDQWIAAVNSAIAVHRSAPEPKPNLHSQFNFSPWDKRFSFQMAMNWNLQNLSFSSLPTGLTLHIVSQKIKPVESRNLVTSQELLSQLDRLDSPLLRAYVAYVSGDEKAIAETFSAPHPEAEDYDFAILRAARESAAERHVEALRIYAKLLESTPATPQRAYGIHSALIAIATKLTPEQRREFEQPLRAALKGLTPPPGPYRDASGIIEQAKQFGFDDMVKSLSPAPPVRRSPSGSPPARIGLPAAIMPPSSNRQQQTSSNPIDRFREFAREGKNAAATREFLKWVGSMKSSGNSMDYLAREAAKSMTPAIKEEILAITNPGSSPSLTKHRAYIDTCLALGERDKALAALNSLAARRPFDPSITCDLAFLLPPTENERAIALLTAAAGSPALTAAISAAQNRIQQRYIKNEVLTFIERIAGLLESSPPEKSTLNNLSQISSLAEQVFTSNIFPEIKPLIKSTEGDDNRPTADANHIAIARRLAISMLRHPSLTETGFSLLNSATWQEKPEDLDAWARASLLLFSSLGKDGRHQYSSNSFPEKSPINYLLARLAKSTPDLLPADFLEALAKNNPYLPTLLRFHSTPATTESIAALWDSDVMEYLRSSSFQTLQQATYKRAAATPGASRFFLTRIREFSKKDDKNEPTLDPFEQDSPALSLLLRAAMETCSSLDEEGVNDTCATIIAVLFPKDQKDPDGQKQYQAINTLQEVFGNFTTDPRTAARIIRAFDSSLTPLPPNWLQVNLQGLQKMKPADVVEAFASMGLLADAASWKPLASTQADYEYSSGKPTFKCTRSDQLKTIASNFYSESREEITKLLANRKPKAFGALITASSFAVGAERENLATEAFRLAAPTLANADARRLDNFALILHLIPHTAASTLPPKLRDIALRNRADLAAALAKTAEQQIEQAIANSQNPLGNITNYCIQLAPLDLPKSVEIFLKATETYLASGNLFANQGITHDDTLHRILYDIGSSENSDPETALRFYQAVLSSPIGARFGITPSNNDHVLLSSIGQSFVRSSSKSPSKHSEIWLAAAKMPEALRQDALAAVACYTLKSGNYLSHEQALKMFANISDPKIHSFAIAANCIRYCMQNKETEATAEITQAFVSLLTNPDFNASARTQISLTAASSTPQILQNPAISKAVADIFVTYCSRDVSVASYLPLSILSNLANQVISPDSIPHLRRINEAFWKNANSPLPGGHLPIPESFTAMLFQTAIKVGDTATAKRLFPLVQSSLTGNLNSIVSMISSGHFDFAAALLPDDTTPSNPENIGLRYNKKLQDQILGFRKTGVNPARLLRLECNLLRSEMVYNPDYDTAWVEERRKELAATYSNNLPTTPSAKIEVLYVLATSTNPTVDALSVELIDFAASLNPTAILNEWAASPENPYKPHTASKWDILCKAASHKLASGDAAPFVTLLSALNKVSKPSEVGPKATALALDRIITYILPATCAAIADGKTTWFSDLLEALGPEVISLSKSGSHNGDQLMATLALCEILAYWESKPEAFSRTLEQIQGDSAEYARKTFSFPRDRSPFLDALQNYNRGRHSSLLGLLPEGFPLALFSHLPISDLLTNTSPTWCEIFNLSNLNEIVTKLALEEFPESITPAARAILLIHRADHFRNIGRRDEVHAQYRASLAVMPPGKPWDYVRTHTRCHLIWDMLKKGKVVEARELFDSIKPAEISEGSKSFYESLSKSLKTKEHGPD